MNYLQVKGLYGPDQLTWRRPVFLSDLPPCVLNSPPRVFMIFLKAQDLLLWTASLSDLIPHHPLCKSPLHFRLCLLFMGEGVHQQKHLNFGQINQTVVVCDDPSKCSSHPFILCTLVESFFVRGSTQSILDRVGFKPPHYWNNSVFSCDADGPYCTVQNCYTKPVLALIEFFQLYFLVSSNFTLFTVEFVISMSAYPIWSEF